MVWVKTQDYPGPIKIYFEFVNKNRLWTQDEPVARTFVLYLCPSSGTPLQKQLQTFWDASSTQIGFNSAHNSFPHITLFSGVSVTDCDVEALLRSVKMVADNFAREFANHGHLKLEKYISPNFVALFVGKNEEILLRSFVQELSDSLASSLGLSPNQSNDAGASSSSNKSYHVTLAYQVQWISNVGRQNSELWAPVL